MSVGSFNPFQPMDHPNEHLNNDEEKLPTLNNHLFVDVPKNLTIQDFKIVYEELGFKDQRWLTFLNQKVTLPNLLKYNIVDFSSVIISNEVACHSIVEGDDDWKEGEWFKDYSKSPVNFPNSDLLNEYPLPWASESLKSFLKTIPGSDDKEYLIIKIIG